MTSGSRSALAWACMDKRSCGHVQQAGALDAACLRLVCLVVGVGAAWWLLTGGAGMRTDKWHGLKSSMCFGGLTVQVLALSDSVLEKVRMLREGTSRLPAVGHACIRARDSELGLCAHDACPCICSAGGNHQEAGYGPTGWVLQGP